MNLTETRAIELLTELMGHKGRLKIKTYVPDPDRNPNVSNIRPSYYIWENVIRMTVEPEKNEATVYSEEGSWCKGYPTTILEVCTAWEREPILEAEETLSKQMLGWRKYAFDLSNKGT